MPDGGEKQKQHRDAVRYYCRPQKEYGSSEESRTRLEGRALARPHLLRRYGGGKRGASAFAAIGRRRRLPTPLPAIDISPACNWHPPCLRLASPLPEFGLCPFLQGLCTKTFPEKLPPDGNIPPKGERGRGYFPCMDAAVACACGSVSEGNIDPEAGEFGAFAVVVAIAKELREFIDLAPSEARLDAYADKLVGDRRSAH